MDGDGNGSPNDRALGIPPTWFSPWNYPTMVDNDLAIAIASDIARGASFRSAAMAHGVSFNRARQWLRYGDEACQKNADGNSPDAQYLNFFLKVQQAVGYASVSVQIQARVENLAWWLAHNPEHRGDWGAANELPSNLLETAEVVEADATVPTPLPTPNSESVRYILKTLIQGGAAIGPDDIIDVNSEQQTG